MKVRGGRGRSALYIRCVYMPTDSTSVGAVDSCYDRLKEDVLCFRGTVVLLGDFNACRRRVCLERIHVMLVGIVFFECSSM